MLANRLGSPRELTNDCSNACSLFFVSVYLPTSESPDVIKDIFKGSLHDFSCEAKGSDTVSSIVDMHYVVNLLSSTKGHLDVFSSQILFDEGSVFR